jgi:hypothetical protein
MEERNTWMSGHSWTQRVRDVLHEPGSPAGVEGGCRWIMMIDANPVASVELVHDGPHAACVRCLRIDPSWYRSSVLPRLIDCLKTYCREQGRHQMSVERGSAPGWIVAELRRRGFRPVNRVVTQLAATPRPLAACQG